MAHPLNFVLALLVQWRLGAAFNLYPVIDPAKLAQVLNISTDCVEALNQTLPDCDQTLFQMADQFENYWWEEDNVTALCNGNCSAQATDWYLNTTSICDEQYVNAYGKLVPVISVTERYVDNMNTICIPSWSENYTWCLTESQEWVGSDIIRPVDCTTTPSDPTCGGNSSAIPADNMRMANLYDDDILCNDCFVQQLYARVTSSYLEDSDFSDYLIEQFLDVQDICSTRFPEFTVRAPSTYDVAPPVTVVTTTTTTTAPPSTSTCAGQVLTQAASSSCDSLSQKFGVSTGDLMALTGSDTCMVGTASVCLPAACTLERITSAGQTCDAVAASLPGNTTTVQFLSWNRNIKGLCDSLTLNQYVCITAPGTGSTGATYTLAPPPLGTDADAGNQQRGGSGGVVTPSSTATTSGNSASEGSGPTPTQDGIAAGCNNYALASADGKGCFDFATAHGIAPSALYAWNPVLGLDGADCTTALWASEYYCIGVWPTAATPVAAPGPTQTGIIATCNKYAQAIAGDGCEFFAQRNSISAAQLYAWNGVLGTSGVNCGSSLWAEEWYCVGIAASAAVVTTTTKPTTTTAATAPGPTQSGISSKCNKFAAAVSGDSCDAFAARNKITDAQLYAWNTVLGANGANCGTLLWADEYYCIGVST